MSPSRATPSPVGRQAATPASLPPRQSTSLPGFECVVYLSFPSKIFGGGRAMTDVIVVCIIIMMGSLRAPTKMRGKRRASVSYSLSALFLVLVYAVHEGQSTTAALLYACLSRDLGDTGTRRVLDLD